jgi:hypothetical protein
MLETDDGALIYIRYFRNPLPFPLITIIHYKHRKPTFETELEVEEQERQQW